MATLFTRIIQGEIPAYKLAEDDHYFSFLDISPLARGHALVVPKQETDYIFDMDPGALSGLMQFAQRVAHAVEKVVPCKRIGIAVIGLEVPHAHVHLVPLQSVHDINFSKPRVQISPEEFAELAEAIAREFK